MKLSMFGKYRVIDYKDLGYISSPRGYPLPCNHCYHKKTSDRYGVFCNCKVTILPKMYNSVIPNYYMCQYFKPKGVSYEIIR